ncbi:hypothetical protein AgCh_020045 [Apium graveolens]
MPLNPNLFQIPPPFNDPQLGRDGIPFNCPSFQQTQDSEPDGEQWQGSMSGFPPRPMVGHVNFMGNNYPQPWGVGPTGAFSDPALAGRENIDAFKNLSMSDSHGRVEVFQGNFKQNEPSYQALYHAANKDREDLSGQNASDPRDVMGMLPPPPGPRPPHSSQDSSECPLAKVIMEYSPHFHFFEDSLAITNIRYLEKEPKYSGVAEASHFPALPERGVECFIDGKRVLISGSTRVVPTITGRIAEMPRDCRKRVEPIEIYVTNWLKA